jgi:hypothetical protein
MHYPDPEMVAAIFEANAVKGAAAPAPVVEEKKSKKRR